jgi:hypothetical protein
MLARLVSRFHAIKSWLCAVFGHNGPASAWTSPASGARVIEFYVPKTFQAPERAGRPAQTHGKVIEFPGRGVKKSA